MSESRFVIDTTDATFAADVLERSRSGLVVVDFWASWCAPCRALGPILEKLADEYGGQFHLVKADTEQNQEAAGGFGVSGIPAVFAVLDGDVIDSFSGALPETAVRSWLDKLLSGTRIFSAQKLLETDRAQGEAALRAILAETPNEATVALSLAEVLLEDGNIEECRELIDRLESRGFLEPAGERIKAALAVQQLGTVDLDAARSAAEAGPKDFALQLKFAEALAGHHQWSEACEVCLQLVMFDRKKTGEQARQLMIDMFRSLPEDSTITSEYRRKLSMALY